MKIFFTLCFFLCSSIGFSQGGVWTWMKGANTGNNSGSYGVKGVAAPTNNPPGRYQAAYWRDLQGNFWIFGGSTLTGVLNDLWKYDVSTNQWTWVSGASLYSAQTGNFGVQGIPSTLNFPSARAWSNSWTDLNGDLWMFAGQGVSATGSSGVLNDLWKYNIATNEWTWVKGSSNINQNASYGSMGVSSPFNDPGARYECKSGWVDAFGDLWMSGGNRTPSSSDYLGDVWRYEIATNQWTWMKGPNTVNDPGNYGILGVESPLNLPPSRWSYTKWKGNDGNFYTFAGRTLLGTLNDLWRFNPVTNNWTWVSGTSVMNNPGTFVGQCNPDSFAYPPSRYETQTAQTIGCSDVFWTFGGQSYTFILYNDLWIYNTATNKWTWVSGSSTGNSPGNYGTQGVPNTNNMISARMGSCMWTDNNSNVWVFGGQYNYTYYNDVWRFQPDTTCFSAPLVASFNLLPPVDSVICLGDTAQILIPATATVSWSPNVGVYPNTDTSILNFSPGSNTTYTVTGVDTGICPGNDTLIFSLYINSANAANINPPQDTVICFGETSILPLDPNLNVSITPFSGITVNTDTSMVYFSPTQTTTYTVIGRYGSCSLPDTAIFTMIVNPVNTVTITPPLPLSICQGESTSMSLDPAWQITYSPGNGVTPNIDTSLLTFSPSSTTTYTITGISTGQCPDTTISVFNIQVTPYTPVLLPVYPNTVICAGQSHSISVPGNLSYTITPSASAGTNADTSVISFSPSSLTTYTLIASGGPCTLPDTITLSVDVRPSPIAIFTLNPNTATLKNAVFTLNNQSQNAVSYSWFLNNVYFSSQTNVSKKITDTGAFCIQLVALANNACTDTAELCGTVTQDPTYIYLPNAFTPNGDGRNDEFKPVAENVSFLKFIVYDRWGNEVFNSSNGTWGWDGKFKGREMPPDTYFYYFSYLINGKKEEKKGDVTLLR
ncbi:MAG: gliding motility-associated C-terminal domain-containing protein [Chitinophagaceae bacterium]|nr:gliding motility-associated C-terminal domain-containing protein [Chitinophagaceae bacterium]